MYYNIKYNRDQLIHRQHSTLEGTFELVLPVFTFHIIV